MGKSKSSAKPAAPVQDVSSIDDIFAGPSKTASSSLNKPSTSSKGKGKALESVPQQSQPAAGDKKKKKAKIAAEFRPDAQTSSTVETVLDPSVRPVEVIAPEVKMSKSGTVKPKKRDRKEVEEDEIFRDSIGDGPRRKTEEGFLIYKEAELKIDPEAGGTPLCPFDCECCY